MVYNEIHKTRSHRIYTHDLMLRDKEEQAYKSKVLLLLSLILRDVKQSGESRCNKDFHNYNKSIVFA